jgi:homoserine kinase
MTVSAMDGDAVQVASFAGTAGWEMLLAVQASSLATKKARALLPETYAKADAVFNVQRSSLLVAAFAQGRLDLLKTAMQDRMHQPYRMEACPLLAKLLPLMEEPEIAGVALSGAGPSVLVFLAEGTTPLAGEMRVRAAAGDEVEVLSLRSANGVVTTLL